MEAAIAGWVEAKQRCATQQPRDPPVRATGPSALTDRYAAATRQVRSRFHTT